MPADETNILIDECEHGHTFAKLPDHPRNDMGPRCPYCMAEGFDLLRARLERAEGALKFYAEQWEQDVDGELTANGWVGSIGDILMTEALRKDCGDIARKALEANHELP